ncbi:aminoglycoside phosphotransferase family protein [Pseudonocardia kujensis]|uniref:phosphotransferase n=1 Tax=Pseudonocardia kujensis TaxID=1128675 RepID=UPI001E4EB39B|nr:phosphotransferase [Pseudonocardia kujensis]MCE0764053.1 aminoglycoside phosphotransferase family protein [Pseudonocardia kujensis]
MTAWLPAVGRRLGGPAEIVGRTPLAGGYVAQGVERVDLRVGDRVVPVVVKPAAPVEVAALRAIAVVEGVAAPRLLHPDPLVLTWVDGEPAAEGDPVPEDVWRTLARVHRHWFRKRPRTIPVVDAAWWAALCERTLVPLRGGAARTGEPAYASAAGLMAEWAHDPRIGAALALLPRTLCHGDPHRGNILGGALIDWGNARAAPAGLDLAVLEAQGRGDDSAYRAEAPALPDPLAAVEREWARAHVHVQYLGFAADHLGADRVAEMTETAAESLGRLGPALRACAG